MGKGKSMSAQRESARQTMSDRASGRTNDKGYRSKGSSYTSARAANRRDTAKAAKAAKAAKEAFYQSERVRLAKIRGETITASTGTQQQPTVQTNAEITGRAEMQGFKEGFTAESQAQSVGDVISIGNKAIGSTVESGVRMVQEARLPETDSRLQAANRKLGKQTSASLDIGGSGIGGSVVSAGAEALGPVGKFIKAGVEADRRQDFQYNGESAMIASPAPVASTPRGGNNDHRDHSKGPSVPSADKKVNTSKLDPSPAVDAPTVEEIVPGIGISTGNVGGRKASFKKKKAVGASSVGGARGRV